MVNKRLLIKNLLAHNDENSFYDKKLRLDLSDKEGKAKFLKHVCALSNSNPANNSYIVIGVRDGDNQIFGVSFFDDSKIQNLINAYLENPPLVAYENVSFPHLPEDKVVGLVTVYAKRKPTLCKLRKNIWKYYGGAVFLRDGSISMPKNFTSDIKDVNSSIVESIEKHSRNNIEMTLDGVFDFLNSHKKFSPSYKVFKEYFVVCWAGKLKKVGDEEYYSRVDIALINEQVRLFYSDFDEVKIDFSNDYFSITEYVKIGYDGVHKYYPFEELTIHFNENGSYDIRTNLLFKPPKFEKSVINFLMKRNEHLISKITNKIELSQKELQTIVDLPTTYLICFLNGRLDALYQLEDAKVLIKSFSEEINRKYKDTLRVIRKIKYN